LDDSAREALIRAQEAAAQGGERHVTPEHLLWALLGRPEWIPSRLLDGFPGPVGEMLALLEQPHAAFPTPREEMRLSPETIRAVELAYTEASRAGKTTLGAEHLFAGLAREGTSDASRLLADFWPGLASVRAEVQECEQEEGAEAEGSVPFYLAHLRAGGASTGESFPGAVLAAVIALLFQGALALPLGAVFLTQVLERQDARALSLALGAAWALACAGFMVPALAARKRWAWSAVEGVLYAKSVVAVVWIGWGFINPGRIGPDERMLTLLTYGGLVAALAISLFHARGWFGIERKQGWTALTREGAWAMAVTGLLEGMCLVAWML
jgi:hypothetical protein